MENWCYYNLVWWTTQPSSKSFPSIVESKTTFMRGIGRLERMKQNPI